MPRRPGHRFKAQATDVSYESTPGPDGRHRFDAKDLATRFKIRYTCIKCGISIAVDRSTNAHFSAAISGTFLDVPEPQKAELRKAGVPACHKWQAVRHVMEV